MDNQWFDTRLIQEIGPVYAKSAKCVFFGPKKMLFMQTESVLQTKNRSEPAKNRFSVALVPGIGKKLSNVEIPHPLMLNLNI